MFQFDNGFFVLAILFILMGGLRMFLYNFQLKAIRNKGNALRKQYAYVGFGYGSKMRVRVISLVCADAEGVIRAVHKLQGITVFERFAESDELNGRSIYALANGEGLPESIGERTRTAAVNACKQIVNYLKKQQEQTTVEQSLILETEGE